MNSFKAATINLRYENEEDQYAWSERKTRLRDLLFDRRPDFFATQEGRQSQLYDLAQLLEGDYVLLDQHREYDPLRMYPCLFVQKDWQVLGTMDRWLSETPEVSGSKSFGSRWPKLAVLAKIKRSNQKSTLAIGSFHFDNVCTEARPKQAQVLLEEIAKAYPGENYILMGDANDAPKSPTLEVLRQEGFCDPWTWAETPITYHAFGERKYYSRIDYILFKSSSYGLRAKYVDDRKDDYYSDHYYVSASFDDCSE